MNRPPTIDGMAKDFKSIWAAYEAFMKRELNVDGLTVLNAFCPPVAEQVRVALLRYAKIEADAEAVKEYTEGMIEAWAGV